MEFINLEANIIIDLVKELGSDYLPENFMSIEFEKSRFYRKGRLNKNLPSGVTEGQYRYQIIIEENKIYKILVTWSYIDNNYIIDEIRLIE